MPPADRSQADFRKDTGAFATTRWSLVLRAGADESHEALAQLCCEYWYPLYAFLRRRGLTMHDAQDVTQAFFAHVIDGDLLSRADAEKGRFRSYLLTSLQHFLASERRREHRQKRGGGAVKVSIDAMKAEERLAAEPSDTRTPEALFERSWAFALIERVFARLAADYERMGRAEVFARLRPYLAGKDGQAGYESVGAALRMNANAVGVAIHRMRQRYGELLRDEIAQTVASPGEVEEELAHLLRVVAGP